MILTLRLHNEIGVQYGGVLHVHHSAFTYDPIYLSLKLSQEVKFGQSLATYEVRAMSVWCKYFCHCAWLSMPHKIKPKEIPSFTPGSVIICLDPYDIAVSNIMKRLYEKELHTLARTAFRSGDPGSSADPS